jgi:hypothetical protein
MGFTAALIYHEKQMKRCKSVEQTHNQTMKKATEFTADGDKILLKTGERLSTCKSLEIHEISRGGNWESLP